MSDEIEDNPTPFVLRDMPKGDFLHTNELADVIGVPGQSKQDRRDLTVRVRGLVNRGYLRPVGRDKDDKRGALLFDAASAVAAAALLAAADAGLSGKKQMERLAFTLETWVNVIPKKGDPRNPAAFAFQTYQNDMRSHGFGAELHTSRNRNTGGLSHKAALRQGDHGYVGPKINLIPEDHFPVATLLIPLDVHLAVILENLVARHQRRKMN